MSLSAPAKGLNSYLFIYIILLYISILVQSSLSSFYHPVFSIVSVSLVSFLDEGAGCVTETSLIDIVNTFI